MVLFGVNPHWDCSVAHEESHDEIRTRNLSEGRQALTNELRHTPNILRGTLECQRHTPTELRRTPQWATSHS